MKKKKKRPPKIPGLITGIAWFRRDQWQQLRMLAADPENLSETYDKWQTGAERAMRELQEKGLEMRKVDVDLKELQAWCLRHRRPLDGAARAEYAVSRVSGQND